MQKEEYSSQKWQIFGEKRIRFLQYPPRQLIPMPPFPPKGLLIFTLNFFFFFLKHFIFYELTCIF